MPRRPAFFRRGVVTLAVLSLLGVGFVVAPQAAQAATGLRAFVSIDVTSMSRLLREEDDFWCGSPEYLVKTDVGMFEQARVAWREHEYSNPSPHEAWSLTADHYVDVAGEVTTFTSPDYPAQEWISGRINVVERDDPCAFPDDQIDVNPQPGADPAQLQFIIEPSTGRVFAYNYRDPLWIVGWIYERPTGGACRFASGKTCYGNVEVRAPGGWIKMTIMLAALA
ncbi:hypothetical protein Prum_005210 [Phytohabitans rumicis]|uniref:Uncharacterized protein n=2 Tax=Phytohabitans rumicis TaxID=1076125 RepID=A0A6V8KX52_9ACTN|nr:hypothetical protein Prum_005210 [Phytohabitans rumicis]